MSTNSGSGTSKEEKKAEKEQKKAEKVQQKEEKKVLKEREKLAKKQGKRKGCNSIQSHTKALGTHYDAGREGKIEKFNVPQDKIKWDLKWDEYAPVKFTLKMIIDDKPVWADPDIAITEEFQKIVFNELDKHTNRFSFVKEYNIVDGLPQNPIGRTGITGRGQLGKWGPNHAADPIVTRWKRGEDGKVVKHADGRKIIEFVCIQRRDTKEWAIPGGMVDDDEEVSLTLKREFGEEALNSLDESARDEMRKSIDKVFKNGEIIYKGYVDDPRNTDNSWMETVASNFHDESGKTIGKIPLAAGDDAQAVRWLSIDGPLELFASHAYFIEQMCKKRGAYFAAKTN